MQTIINGLLTNYKVYGEENNQAVVILHGWGRSLTEWEGVADYLASSYKLVLVDLPGFGGTVAPKEPYGVVDYAHFIESLLAKLSIKHCTLVGHSVGGRIAIVLGTSNLVSKLILVDSAGIEKKKIAYKAFLRVAKLMAKLFPLKVVRKVKTMLGSADYNAAGELRETLVKIVNEDLSPVLPKITKPTLVVWGSNDSVLPVDMTTFFKSAIPDCVVRIIWGAGHDPHLDKPTDFINIVMEFLDAK